MLGAFPSRARQAITGYLVLAQTLPVCVYQDRALFPQ